MKYFLVALLIIIVAGYFYIKSVLDKFSFSEIKFTGGDLRGILGGTSSIGINLSTTITNKNNFSVPVSDMQIELYHEGKLVGSSTAAYPDFIIPANGSVTINLPMSFNIQNSLAIATKLLSRTPVILDYTIKGKLFGFYPLSYSSNFTFNS